MIFLLSLKYWDKNKKKLVEPKDYIVLDATDDGEARLSSFTNVVAMDNFAIPVKLLKYSEELNEIEDDFIDLDRMQDMEKDFFRSHKFASSVAATVSVFLEKDINVFIIIRNKAFKFYRYYFKNEFCKVFPDAANCFVVLEKDLKTYKKELNHSFSSKEIEIMKKALRKKEKELEEDADKRKKKAKKKRKKGNGYGWSN
jgi:hypothetical protein